MMAKQRLPSRLSYANNKDKEDKETVAANHNLIAKVAARVEANLAEIRSDGDGDQKYPLSMPQFNDVRARKTVKEFVRKSHFETRCALNAFNNALPSGILITPRMMMLLRDMKLLQLMRSAIGLYKNQRNPKVIVLLATHFLSPCSSRTHFSFFLLFLLFNKSIKSQPCFQRTSRRFTALSMQRSPWSMARSPKIGPWTASRILTSSRSIHGWKCSNLCLANLSYRSSLRTWKQGPELSVPFLLSLSPSSSSHSFLFFS